jgi:tetratricopeptide (TPR) repeat protein
VSEVWEVLGYEGTASEIAIALGESKDIEVIEGPPGCGKSWLAKGVGGLWEMAGGSTVLVEGDRRRSDVALYALSSAMRALPDKFPIWSLLGNLAQAGEGALLGTGGALTKAVELLVETRGKRHKGRAILLDDAEQDIVAKLDSLSRKGPLLIVADNLHWWDARSIDLLGSLRDSRMAEAFPFLDEMRLLAVQTGERHQAAANPTARDTLLVPLETRRIDLEKVPREKFGGVLAALGAEPPPAEDVVRAIYELSGGHLALAHQCARRIAVGEAEIFLSVGDEEEFVRSLLSERLQNLGDTGRLAVGLLEVAAILGLTFDRREVMCASTLEESETARLLRFCRDESILEPVDDGWNFAHEHYQRYFLDLGGSDRAGIHERWGSCLCLLRPGDYELRCINALDGDSPMEAATFGVLAALQAEREARPWGELPPTILDAIDACSMTGVLKRLVTAHRHLNEYRFEVCLETLDAVTEPIPQQLRAERDYLRAMCLMSTRSESDRTEGRSMLRAWDGYEREEPEIGIRLMLLLLYGMFHLLDKEQAWDFDALIRQRLNERASFDPTALDALHTLERCAGGLYETDVALRKNRRAAAYFGPGEGQSTIRRPVEYYRSLVNLGASLINNGDFEKARDAYCEVDKLIDSYPEGVFPRIDYPKMNCILAEHRMEAIDPAEAALRQRQVVETLKIESDPFYLENALAVYLCLDGRHEESLEIYDRLDDRLFASRSQPEPSMIYLIKANRCAARFVAGQVVEAQEEWPRLAEAADLNAYTDRAAVLRRHRLLAELIAQGRPVTAREFDRYLIDCQTSALGPLWKASGRGFEMPAIEFWREN